MLDKTERKIKRLIRRAMSRIARDTRYQVPFDWLERRAERAERMRALSEGGDVATLRPTSRDLTLEAFENDHPHIIYD